MIAPDNTKHWTDDLMRSVQEAARDCGFDLAGVAPATGTEDGKRFVDWVEAGRAGEMEWLKRRDEQGTLLRSAVDVAIPWARSVIVCAASYHADAPHSIDPAPPGAGWIGRYAWRGTRRGEQIVPADYHVDLLLKLRQVEAALQRHTPCDTRCYVDTGPLVERAAAVKAGIGWVGKNTCLLNQEKGSWLLLGVIVTSLDTSPNTVVAMPAVDRCGSCTRCIDACPTRALVAPRQMDASLCIAYLTIEKKGEIPIELRGPIGRNIFGCDICEDVCPWNQKAPFAQDAGMFPRMELVNPSLTQLAQLDASGFRLLFNGSPLERTGRKRLHRNVAIAMGNSGDATHIPQLETWTASADIVLAQTAAWALERLRNAECSTCGISHVPSSEPKSLHLF